MILRAAIVTLLVLNIGIAAWWLSGANALPPRAATPANPAIPRLRLVDEPVAAAPAADHAGTPPAAGMPAQPDAAVAAAAPAAADVPRERCLRFGPFADAAARDAARPALAGFAAALLPRDIPAKSSRGWKVHIPPFATREEARAMGERIKAVGITDWYPLNEGADANSIALGRYGSEEAARRREAELKAKGIPAQAAPIGDSAPQWWLDARLKPTTDIAALAGIAASKSIDCAILR